MFEVVQHTADIRLHVRAASLEDLFREAMRGMFAIMAPSFGGRDSRFVDKHLAIDSVDRTTLLVDFLSEVLSRAHIDRVAFEEVAFGRLTETDLVAAISGHAAEFEKDVKAVTYHEAEVREVNGEWETMLVFDI